MSTNTSEISQLANILHQDGDKVLNALSKLSLNAILLQKLNKEFDLFLENLTDGEESFHVVTPTHGNSQLLKDLNFLHDFIQKTVGLKLTHNPSLTLLNQKLDIGKFKSIKYLEIKKIPIKQIIGMKSIQSQLESIVCIRCLLSLEELLRECGGDNSKGFVWSELREAVLSFNNIKAIDTSIAFAPWLQVLDLSHNQITDVKAIECLPNLKYVNLSFNCIDVIPTFNKSARKKIELLVLKNNYIEDLSGIRGLSHLTELDISNNWIANWDILDPLLVVSTLQWLSLEGNPISCHSYYRQRVAGYLHISASFSDFYLDKLKLSKKEKTIVGIKLCDENAALTKSHIESLSKESFRKQSPLTDRSKEQNGTSRKSGKPRVVVIPNLDDGTYEETPCSANSLEFSVNSSTEYLITKKRIENARSIYGIDNWLVQGSSVVQDILGLPPAQVSTSTPCDDMCLKAALDSARNIVTTVAVIESQPNDVADDSDKNNLDSFTTCNEGDSTSNYFSAETSGEKGDSSKERNKEIVESSVVDTKEISPDIEEIQEEEEEPEIEIDENEKLYVVQKEVKLPNKEILLDEMFLTITESELRERETIRGRIITKWCLTSLESCEKLKSNKLLIVFDTVRRDKKERVYRLDEQDSNALYKQMSEILESRSLRDMNQVVYKCENCSSQFSSEINSRKTESSECCPFCHSKFILQLDEVPLPSKESERKTVETKNVKNTGIKASHNRSSSASGFFQSFMNQSDDKMLKCASQSSIGSAASLEGINELPTIQNSNIKRSDSDIEILSNPSQSSIEVIEGPTSRWTIGNGPRRKKLSEERQDNRLESAATSSSLNQTNAPIGLTESSSSGSITDSICTAYESSSATTSAANKLEGSKGLGEETQNGGTKSDPILQDVLKTAVTKCTNEVDLVKYSYSDFTSMDHRIKLFLYTHVFDDASEEFSFGLRAVVAPVGTDNGITTFPACVIFSNRNLYFLKVINREKGDDARNFLQKIDSMCFNLNTISSVFILTWYQGLGVKVKQSKNKWKQYLILLMDPARTKNFINYLNLSGTQGHECIQLAKEVEERPYWAVQHLLLSCTSLEDTNIQYFCLFNSCSIRSNSSNKDIQVGGILTNSTELLLIVDQLNWLFDGTIQPPNLEYLQKFRNLVQVFVNKLIVILHFSDVAQQTEVWNLVMEGEESVDELLNRVKESWEKLFSTPLQVTSL
ncbi:hypothetical protein RUM44_006173 [Polyplax serrata]|uniref:Serine/threonine-protein kinase 11-interacting protein n=1 Tax=Polyplax serrata TaxID=468196 RepID=A0ABR1AZ63_POLSC